MDTNQNAIDILSIKDKLRDNELFRNLNISSLDIDDLKLNLINLKKGEILFRQGDPANSIYLVIEGEINLIKKQTFGKTHSLLSKNNFFGHEEYFLKTNRNSIAIALKDSRIAELSKENIEIILSRDSSVLNNLKKSMLDLDSASIDNFENAIEELPDCAEKMLSDFPMELTANNDNGNSLPGSADDNSTTPERDMFVNKIDLKKIESGINKIINNLNENLSLLEKEKSKVREAVSGYEIDNKKLLDEIEKLKEQERRFISLDKEKNEILGSQSYRIIELEKETAKFKELESKYSKKIEFLSEQEAKDKIRIKKLEADLKEKETIISKLDNDLKENKKTISDFNESRLKLLQEKEDKERIIKEQKAELKSLSAKLGELQNQLDNQKESEKNKNEYILNQSHKIAEYEESLKNYKKELSKKEETTNNFIQEIGELSENVWQKQSEINEQNQVIIELNDEIVAFKKSSEEFTNKENDFNEKIFDLKSQLSKVNSELSSLSEDVKEKSRKVEIKEKENSDIQKNLEELKNTLEKRNNKINDLENLLAGLKNELSESQKLKEEFNSLKTELISKNNSYNELKNENSTLSEQIKNLKLQIEENKNESNTLLKVNDELNQLKSEAEKYKNCIKEKDKLIEEQTEKFENLKLTKSAIIKTLTSTKSNYEEEIKKKDDQIAELVNKLEDIQKSLEEKAFLENQQVETIENQAQKIAELEVLVNESKVKSNNQVIVKEESILKDDSPDTDSEEQVQSNENEEIFSKCKLITSKPANSFMSDNSFEHFQYSDIHIVNVNLTRATMDMASTFNKFLQEIISKERNKIIVNLSDCEYIDSSILGVLVSSLKKAITLDGELKIVWRDQSEYSMFYLTKMDNIFRIFNNLKDAVNSFS